MCFMYKTFLSTLFNVVFSFFLLNDFHLICNLITGVKWVPELLDHHTEEWQRLAQDVKEEVNICIIFANLFQLLYYIFYYKIYYTNITSLIKHNHSVFKIVKQ